MPKTALSPTASRSISCKHSPVRTSYLAILVGAVPCNPTLRNPCFNQLTCLRNLVGRKRENPTHASLSEEKCNPRHHPSSSESGRQERSSVHFMGSWASLGSEKTDRGQTPRNPFTVVKPIPASNSTPSRGPLPELKGRAARLRYRSHLADGNG